MLAVLAHKKIYTVLVVITYMNEGPVYTKCSKGITVMSDGAGDNLN